MKVFSMNTTQTNKRLRLPKHGPPITVGEMLVEAYIEPLDMTQQRFADAIGIDRQSLNAIIKGRRSLTIEMAMRLGRVLGTSVEFWLNLQRMTELYIAENSDFAKTIAKIPVLVDVKQTAEARQSPVPTPKARRS